MMIRVKASTLMLTGAVFLFGSVNLYPCATGSETVSTAKESCHSEKGIDHNSGVKNAAHKDKPKPCCTLHCYNPAQAQATFVFAKPARAALRIHHPESIFFSLTITPPYPPPQQT